MAKTAKKADEDVIREGWKILIDKMGVAKATRFLTAFERGEGDSVKEINVSGGEVARRSLPDGQG